MKSIELIAADLRMAQEMFKVLDQAAAVEGVHWCEIRFRGDGEADTIIVSYGEQAEAAIVGIVPAGGDDTVSKEND